MASLIETITRLVARVAELERKLSNQMRHGTIAEVDNAKQQVRLKFGDGENGGSPYLSPWVPYSQTAGDLKVKTVASVGQQMTLFAPNGDFNQAVAVPMGWSNQNASPSDNAGENALTFGSIRVELRGDELFITAPKLKITAGGHVAEFSAAGLTMTGGAIKHDNKNIGSSHTHSGILPGPANTGTPNS
jgi:phage baseplate assembly protein V